MNMSGMRWWLAAVVAIPWLGYKLLPDPRAPRRSGWLERRLPGLVHLAARIGLSGPPHGEDHDVYGTAFYIRFRRLVAWCVTHAFADILKNAQHPLIILGAGALARPDGAAIMALAPKTTIDPAVEAQNPE